MNWALNHAWKLVTKQSSCDQGGASEAPCSLSINIRSCFSNRIHHMFLGLCVTRPLFHKKASTREITPGLALRLALNVLSVRFEPRFFLPLAQCNSKSRQSAFRYRRFDLA